MTAGFSLRLPLLCLLAVALMSSSPAHSQNPPQKPAPAKLQRGKLLYIANCALCHQVNGVGAAGVYPPLAASDFLKDHRADAILAIVQGRKGPITVNGHTYDNRMPAIALNDQQVADVLTYVYNSWNNPGGEFTESEVLEIRSKSEFKTFADLLKANEYPPLPKAPQGFALREFLRLPDFAVRIASDGRGKVAYLLSPNGNISRLDLVNRRISHTNYIRSADYADLKLGDPSTLGLTLDPQGHLWITCNQRNESARPFQTNEVTIFKTTAKTTNGDPILPKPWFRTSYPWGIGPYNHGVGHIAFGPDGKLYVTSGSRTDGGEPGKDPALGPMGETDQTAVLWKFDPAAAHPQPEVIARGIRNAWSFAWTSSGELFSVSNGPDAHADEEMDWIRPNQPRHHGFPYQFENWPIGKKAYPHTPDAPTGVTFAHPVANLGPDGRSPGKTGYTFHPHSSPAGMVWLNESWPSSVRNSFLVGRFGNLIQTGDTQDVGFDILSVRPRLPLAEPVAAQVTTLLAPLGRPIDLHLLDAKRILVLEYTRPTNFKEQRGWLPGRILELTAH